jgi:hypothetical protein
MKWSECRTRQKAQMMHLKAPFSCTSMNDCTNAQCYWSQTHQVESLADSTRKHSSVFLVSLGQRFLPSGPVLYRGNKKYYIKLFMIFIVLAVALHWLNRVRVVRIQTRDVAITRSTYSAARVRTAPHVSVQRRTCPYSDGHRLLTSVEEFNEIPATAW